MEFVKIFHFLLFESVACHTALILAKKPILLQRAAMLALQALY